jgi:hypothetical protein
LHWADKQKPLQEVAGQFAVFPQAIKSPPLVPEEIDEETPLRAEEVALAGEQATLVERITVSEHFMAVEYVAVRPPECPAEPPAREPEIAA